MSTPQRLPIVNSDDGTWGDIIRQFLMKEHYDDGADHPYNGGHQNITVRPGTATAGTAPLKFTSGTLLTAAEAGAVEFNSDSLYFTITTGAVRKKVAIYDDSSGATGDMYYRDSSGNLVRVGVGSTGQALTVSSGLPTWGTVGASTMATSTKTTSYTITNTDAVILANATSGSVTITLPAASGVSGYRFYIKRVDGTAGNTVSIATTGGDTIDGATAINVVSQYDTYEVVSNGTIWYVLAATTKTLATSTIAFRSVSTNTQASAASIVGTKPTGTSVGDVLVAYFTVYPGATTVTLPAPTGWTAIGSLASYTSTHQIYSQAFYKVAGSSEPGSYTFTSTVAKPCDLAIMAYTGVDTNNPIDASSANAGSGTTRTGTAITTTNANEMLLYLASGFSGSITAAPTGSTQRAVYDTTNNYTYDIVAATAGSTGNITATGSASDSWTVNLVALKPAGSSTGSLDFSESFEGGSNGSNVTTSTTSFSSVVATGTVVFDNAHAADGTLSAKFTSNGAGGNSVYLQHNLSTAAVVYCRAAMYLSSWPVGQHIVIMASSTSGTADAGDVRINATGTVSLRNNAVAVVTSTTTVPTGSWFMIEYGVDSNNSIQTARIYSGLTTDSIQEVISGTYTLGTVASLKYGINSTVAITYWMDAIASSLTNWVGGTVSSTLFSGPVTFNNNVTLNGVSGATGDIYYRNSAGVLTPLSIGSTGQALKVSSGLPSWGALTPSISPSTQTSNYTLLTTDTVILVDATSGNLTMTLPTAVSSTAQYSIKKIDSSAHTVTINTTSSQTIDGSTSAVIKVQYASITVVSNNANWLII